jgi:hypothetical protein
MASIPGRRESRIAILGYNTTTNAYRRTGMYSSNPFNEEWMWAIETLGLKNDDESDKLVQYEVVPKEERQGRYNNPTLTNVEKKSSEKG